MICLQQKIIDSIKNLYSNTQIGVILFSPEGKLIWINERSLLKDMTQAEFDKIFKPFDEIWKVVHIQYRGLNLSARGLRLEHDGILEGYLVRGTSSAEIMQLSMNLDIVNRILAQYADIRESVSSIIAGCTVLQQRLDNRGMYEDLKLINMQTTACYRILAALCNYQECTKYAFDVSEKKLMNLSAFVTNTASHILTLINRPDVKIRVKCDKNIFVETDPDRFMNCFLNIIANSIQHNISESKNILVTLKKAEENSAIISVKDNGLGISARAMRKIDSYRLCHLPYPQVSEDYDRLDYGCGFRVITLFCKTYGCNLIINTKENEGTTISIKMPVCESVRGVNTDCHLTDYMTNRFSNLFVILSKISPINFA